MNESKKAQFTVGDRVGWAKDGKAGVGTVYWVGESDFNGKLRIGIDDTESGSRVWVGVRQCRHLVGEELELMAELEAVASAKRAQEAADDLNRLFRTARERKAAKDAGGQP